MPAKPSTSLEAAPARDQCAQDRRACVRDHLDHVTRGDTSCDKASNPPEIGLRGLVLRSQPFCII
jgi:hypothetical protein